MAEKVSNSSSTEQAKEYISTGIAYVQNATFGTGQSEREATSAQDSTSHNKSDSAFDAKVDKAGKGDVEDFLRSQTRTEPPKVESAE